MTVFCHYDTAPNRGGEGRDEGAHACQDKNGTFYNTMFRICFCWNYTKMKDSLAILGFGLEGQIVVSLLSPIKKLLDNRSVVLLPKLPLKHGSLFFGQLKADWFARRPHRQHSLSRVLFKKNLTTVTGRCFKLSNRPFGKEATSISYPICLFPYEFPLGTREVKTWSCFFAKSNPQRIQTPV
jgi:hypothetical protein